MSNSKVTAFYGVSNYNCNNSRLFEFVQDNQKTGKTILQYRERVEDGNTECIIGLPIDTDSEGNINMLSLVLVQDMFDKDEHAQAANTTPKIYFL